MSGKRYTEEFKIAAVKQVAKRGQAQVQTWWRAVAGGPNYVQCQFDLQEPNRVWVTDITYIRTHEGWLYLAVVLDLFRVR